MRIPTAKFLRRRPWQAMLLAVIALSYGAGRSADQLPSRPNVIQSLELTGLLADENAPWEASLPGVCRREAAAAGDVFGGRLQISIRLGRNPGGAAVRLSVYVVNRNGWFYKSAEDYLLNHLGFRDIEIDLSPDSGDLVPAGTARPWGDASGLAVEKIGLALFCTGSYGGPVEVRRAAIVGGSGAAAIRLASPAVEGLEVSPAAPGTGDLVELAFRYPVSFANPFDPVEADINIAVTGPDGVRAVIPAYFDQEYLPVQEGFDVRAVPVGPGRWKARFRPASEGRFRVEFLSPGGGAAGETEVVVSGPGRGADADGLVRTDDAHLSRLANILGENFLRPMPADPGRGMAVWRDGEFKPAEPDPAPVSAWIAPIEWTSEWGRWLGAGRYNLEMAWKLDLALDRAARSGVRRPICLNFEGMFEDNGRSPTDEPDLQGGAFLQDGKYRWAFNPLNAQQGGPLKSPEQYFCDSGAERAAAALFRYILARWGQHPAVSGGVLGVTMPAEGATAWHERVGRQLAAWFGPNDGRLKLASWHPHALAMPDALAIGSFEDGSAKGWRLDEAAAPTAKATYTVETRSEGQRALRIEGDFPGLVCSLIRPLDMNCASFEQVSFDALLAREAPPGMHVRVMMVLRDRELNWYQRLLPGEVRQDGWTRFLVDLRDGRNGLTAAPPDRGEPALVRPWDDYSRQRMRVLGFQFFAWSEVPQAETSGDATSRTHDAPSTGTPEAARGPTRRGAILIDNIRLHGPGRLAAGREPELRMLDFRAENAETPETFTRVEYTFALNRAFPNPYDPECVDVRAMVMTPSGRVMTVPGFYYQGYQRRLSKTVRVEGESGAMREIPCPEGAEELLPSGGSFWKIRLAAAEPGQHLVEIQVRGPGPNGEQVTLLSRKGLQFEAKAGRRPGYVRLAADGRHLEHSTGEFFYPLGMALRSPSDARDLDRDEGIRRKVRGDAPVRLKAFRTGQEDYLDFVDVRGTYQFDDYLEQCGKAGVNWARVWMCPWWLGLEWDHRYPGFEGAGRYSQANAWRLDHVIEQAERCGMYLQLCLINHGQVSARIDRQWDFNPWNKVMPGELYNAPDRPADPPFEERPGGFLDYPRDFFLDERARKLFRQRLRYVAARWGYSTSLMGYEIMSEVEFTGGTEYNKEGNFDNRPLPMQAAWHREMAQYMRTIDPFRHLVTTHFSHPLNGNDVWETRSLDYVQSNAYSSFPWFPGGGGTAAQTIGAPRAMQEYYQRFMMRWNRPVLIGEWGGHWMNNNREVLDAELHSGLWAQAATPMAGATGYWWWLHVHYNDRYGEFAAVRRFLEGEDLRGVTLQMTGSASLRGGGNGGAEFDVLACGDKAGRAYAYVCPAAMRRSLADRARAKHAAGDVTLDLQGLPEGTYTVEFWNTWTGKLSSSTTARSAGGRLSVPLPEFEGDVALKVRRAGGAAGTPSGTETRKGGR